MNERKIERKEMKKKKEKEIKYQ